MPGVRNVPIDLPGVLPEELGCGHPDGKEAIMDSQRKCRVIGMLDNGDEVPITTYTTRDNAERIVKLLELHCAFAKLTIECDDETG
jgi:hypothetical protein